MSKPDAATEVAKQASPAIHPYLHSLASELFNLLNLLVVNKAEPGGGERPLERVSDPHINEQIVHRNRDIRWVERPSYL